ncbi:hemopexin [Hippocampus zosterae]|uniref:hemopexin n=1 Tax=Hippocampus zosterae TaxID=109293 RepID=UPI00223D8619|nr:hemopexin [Hippocampus zosterae]
MKLLATLCLGLVLGLAASLPLADVAQGDEGVQEAPLPDRCDGLEFDAITPDEKGNTIFFKGAHLWNGFHGPAQLANELFKELDDDHHIGHVDAAFRMHDPDNHDDHDHIYFFLDDKVFSYYNHSLESGYPKAIQEDFPGVPSHLDSAVECPKQECATNSVLFFKGHDVHVFDLDTKQVKTKTWANLPVCTSALRWLEHYYCFHGHNFTRFNPVTGEVSAGGYPKDARNYFMKCADFGHGGNYEILKCSDVKLDAITTDNHGKTYFFAGPIYMRLDTDRDGLHAFPITRGWKEMTSGVDAVFSYTDKLYMIKGDQVYIFKSDAHHTLIEGYPKSVKEELGIEGPIDAAFLCPDQDMVHIIKGGHIYDINLLATPRAVTRDFPLPFSGLDAALCGADGVRVFKGPSYFHYESAFTLSTARIAPVAEKITHANMGCRE